MEREMKMEVAIWSDIRCPFCYIGKRKFESALAQFDHKDHVSVEWHSFELDPALKTRLDMNVYDYLAEHKGMSREYSIKMHDQVAKTAETVGLKYHFDIAVVANSLDAHRLIQLAKTKGLGPVAEEVLFKAYFTNGVDISDKAALTTLGVEMGLEIMEVDAMLQNDSFTKEVREDEALAQTIGVTGVPFFVLHNKYAISGAQSTETFLEALKQTWNEMELKNNG